MNSEKPIECYCWNKSINIITQRTLQFLPMKQGAQEDKILTIIFLSTANEVLNLFL